MERVRSVQICYNEPMPDFGHRFTGYPELPENWREYEGPPKDLVHQRLGEYWQQFQQALHPQRHLDLMKKRLLLIKNEHEAGEIGDHEYVVQVFEVLNFHGEPMTAALAEELDIPDALLYPEDFDHIFVDFLEAKHAERMMIDYDSVPDEGFPMYRSDYGDQLKGILRRSKEGIFHLETDHSYPYALAQNETVLAQAGQLVDKKIRTTLIGSDIHGFELME